MMTISLAIIVILASSVIVTASNTESTLPLVRPAPQDRTFQSAGIDALIDGLYPLFDNENLAVLFSNCFPNTLDTTVASYTHLIDNNGTQEELDSFIITGDINALWLRDSANQVMPYLPYGSDDPALRNLIEGLINRHAKSVLIDSFANAFNYNASGEGHQTDTRTPPMSPSVFEGKYEIDSLAAFLKLSYWHWQFSGDDALVRFGTDDWLAAVQQAVDTIREMQETDGAGRNPPYLFQRLTTVATDTLMMQGRGPPAQLNGMSRSLFRPSDDAVTLPYNIPGNAMACVELTHTAAMLRTLVAQDVTHSSEALQFSMHEKAAQLLIATDSVRDGICKSLDNAIATARMQSKPLPYEIDGFSSEYYMDDANIPSLLSLPVLGYIPTDNRIYQTTREFVLSSQNPFFFNGLEGSGIGGPHEGYNYTWPMAIIMQAMTSDDDAEISWCLDMLIRSSADTGFMHESFDVNNVYNYTRDWFAWVNGMLGELLLQLITTKPHLVLLDDADAVATAQELVKAPVSLLAQQNTVLPR